MSIFVLGDTHLSLSVEKPMDVFGSRWRNYTDKLKDGWCSTVKSDDTVVIPGDISWAMTLEEALEDFKFLNALPGKKIIGKGNHDYWWGTRKKTEAFFMVNGIDSIELLMNNAYLRDGKLICGSRGWFTDDKNAPDNADYEKIMNREAMRLKASFDYGAGLSSDAEKLCFLHFPPLFGDFIAEEIINVIVQNGVKRCWYCHLHSVYDIPQSISYKGVEFILSSSDYLNFIPLKIL